MQQAPAKKTKLETSVLTMDEGQPVSGFLALPRPVFKNIFIRLPVRERFRAMGVCRTFETMLSYREMYSDMGVCNLAVIFKKDTYLSLSFLCKGKLKAIGTFGFSVRELTARLELDAFVKVLPSFQSLERLKVVVGLGSRRGETNTGSHSHIVEQWRQQWRTDKLVVPDLRINFNSVVVHGLDEVIKDWLPILFDVSKIKRFSVAGDVKLDATKLGLAAFTNIESLQLTSTSDDVEPVEEFGWQHAPVTLRELDVYLHAKDVPNMSRFSSLEKLSLRVYMWNENRSTYDDELPYDEDVEEGLVDGSLVQSLSTVLLNNAEALSVLQIDFTHHPLRLVKESHQLFEVLSRLHLTKFKFIKPRFERETEVELMMKSLFHGSSGSLQELVFDLQEPALETVLAPQTLSGFQALKSLVFYGTENYDSRGYEYDNYLGRRILNLVLNWPVDRPCLRVSCCVFGCHDGAWEELKKVVKRMEITGRFTFDIDFDMFCPQCVV